MATSQGFANWICGPKLNPSFLQYLLLSEESALDRFSIGTTIKTIYYPDIKALHVCIPPLPEQQRIVTKLDAAFGALREAEGHVARNRANARELFESYLNGVFEGGEIDGELMRLGDVCKTGSGSTPLRSRKDYYKGGDIPWLLSGEVAQGEVTKATNFITELALKETSVKLFPSGTVLVAMYGATAGEVGILRFASTTNQAVCGILPNDRFLPEYLYFVFLQKKAELVAQAVGGAQPNISQEKIKNTLIPVPALEQQKDVIKRLEAVRNQSHQLEATYQQKLRDLEGLKKGLLGAAFRGEL
jgi:restriction endonuclease S subunit